MKVQNFCLVETVVRTVIRMAKRTNGEELLELFSRAFLQTMITNGNIGEITNRINQLRFSKENAFARKADLEHDWRDRPGAEKRFQRLMNTQDNKLSPYLASLKKQIKFLDIVSRSIDQLMFV